MYKTICIKENNINLFKTSFENRDTNEEIAKALVTLDKKGVINISAIFELIKDVTHETNSVFIETTKETNKKIFR